MRKIKGLAALVSDSVARLNLSLADEQKERWQDTLSELDEVNNLSELVRKSVELYIADELDGDSSSVPADLNDTVADLESSLDNIETNIADVEDQIKLARTESISEEEFEAIVHEQTNVVIRNVVESRVLPALQQILDQEVIEREDSE